MSLASWDKWEKEITELTSGRGQYHIIEKEQWLSKEVRILPQLIIARLLVGYSFSELLI